MTRRIELRCEQFSVSNIQQRLAKANLDETWEMELNPHAMVMLREVSLLCGSLPLVFAHSVLPLASLYGEWQNLRKLGSQSLGRALFADPRVQRTPLQYKKLSPHHALYIRACHGLPDCPSSLWARRSVFSLNKKNLMVTEVFLPGILHL